jgi:tyrosyl-tRNA synthetase
MDPIEELLTRGVDKIYPSKEALEEVLRSGKKLTLYQGFDPTGSQLHIGHMIGLRKLKQWQMAGHHVIFLIGDFTGMIGDPSGKTITRPMLTREEVLKNAQSYKDQAGKILDFSGKNPIEIRFNSEWLEKITAIEFLRIAGQLSVQQVVERDLFQERQKSGQDIYMNEFLYPVMQAYDSVAMNVDLEIGGSDQMFNMLMGRKLMRHMLKKDKFVITTPLLTDSEGRKVGKTEGTAIALTDDPSSLYGKIMALGDDVIVKGMKYLTDLSMDEVKEVEKKLSVNEHPMPYKKRLAYEVVKQLNSENAAAMAQAHFEKTVQQHEVPEEIQEITVPPHAMVNDGFLVELTLALSKSDAKRLFQQGGVEVNGEKIMDPNATVQVEDGMIVRIGKRRIVKLRTS